MSVRLRTHTGTIVDTSESNAKRLVAQFGWKYLMDEIMRVETISEPVTATPAPKRRGRPPKPKETND